VWVDGTVTAAFKAGQWLCLDNLGEAEASVLERLNPLLESPAIWTLTEQGCTEPLPCLQTFRFMATMTPPSRQGKADVGTLSAELSPALYNRLSIVVMDDVLEGSDEQFSQEMRHLAEAICCDDDDDAGADSGSSCDESQMAAAVCQHIRHWLHQQQAASRVAPVTLRGYVRLLDSCYILQQRHQLPFAEALLAAFDLLSGQFAVVGEAAVKELRSELQQLLQVNIQQLLPRCSFMLMFAAVIGPVSICKGCTPASQVCCVLHDAPALHIILHRKRQTLAL